MDTGLGSLWINYLKLESEQPELRPLSTRTPLLLASLAVLTGLPQQLITIRKWKQSRYQEPPSIQAVFQQALLNIPKYCRAQLELQHLR
jgi:hypothetical protein